jgi:hypothetical protein
MSTASNPACLTVSAEKFSTTLPRPNFLIRSAAGLLGIPLASDIYGKEAFDVLLQDGDARAAIVVHTDPVTVAAYSDEFDAVILLRIPEEQCVGLNPRIGSKMIAVFNYLPSLNTPRDIFMGEQAGGEFRNAEPLIGDLLSDDIDRLQELRESISEAEWERARQLGEAGISARPNLYRLHKPGSTRGIAGDLWIMILASVFFIAALVVGLWMFA